MPFVVASLQESLMSRLRVESFTISLDGFGAGPNQDFNNPLGVGGTSLHGWAISTRTFQKHCCRGPLDSGWCGHPEFRRYLEMQ
jgi:hypothetical protein